MSQSRFDAVFIAHRRTLLRSLQRMVDNPSTAEDLLHETYLRVTRALHDRPVAHLEPFVFQTARNLALDHLRARRLREGTLLENVAVDVLHNVAAPASTAEDAAHAGQLLQRLSSRLARLTERQQRIFILSRLHGHSCAEIAQALQVSPSTVQKELKWIMAICMGVAQRMETP